MHKSIDTISKLCYIKLTETQDRKEAEALFNQNLLKAKIIEKGLSTMFLCNSLGICEATFYRKLSRNGDFSRFEINKIAEELNLSCKERDDIFFAQ